MVENKQRRLDHEHSIHPLRGFFIPGVKLPEGLRPIGKWGRRHRDYLSKVKMRLSQEFE